MPFSSTSKPLFMSLISVTASTIAQPIRWVKETLPARWRLRWLLITMRLSNRSLTGTSRTEVAVGTVRDSSMFLTTAAAGPRSFVGSGSCSSTAGICAVVVGTLAGRSEVVETAGVLGAGVEVGSFTAGDSFAGVEAADGAAGEEGAGVGDGAGAGVEVAGAGASSAASSGAAAAAGAASGDEGGAVTGGAVAASEVSGPCPGASGASARAELVEAKCSAQLGSTLEGSSRHCSRSASTSH